MSRHRVAFVIVLLNLFDLACGAPNLVEPDGGPEVADADTPLVDAGPPLGTDAGPVLQTDAGPAPDAGPCPLDSICDDADACTMSDRCTVDGCVGTPRTCDTPPASECIGDILRTYAAVGECTAGDCRYAPTDSACLDGCVVDGAGPRCADPPIRAWLTLGASVSADHACAVRMNGELWCWGSDTQGELGDGSPNTRHLVPVQAAGITDAIDVAVGEGYTCVLHETGRVSCWGRGTSGELGDGMSMSSLTPVEVSGLTDAVQVEAGHDFACALRATGAVVCWGDGRSGKMGSGFYVDQPSPGPVMGLTDVVEIDIGLFHTCALHATGHVSCWGYNADGQIGNPSGGLGNQPAPYQVEGVDDATAIATGRAFSCALRPSGTVCWGDNDEAQIGTGSSSAYERTPFTLAFTPAPAGVAAGGSHTCVRMMDGTAQCWGAGLVGQLGQRAEASSPTPVDVYALTGARELVAANTFSCALTGDEVFCWGTSAAGLGTGDANRAIAPTLVLLP